MRLPLIGLLCWSAGVLSAAEVVAHRGASADAPENTIVAAKLAFEQGAHGVECDIFRTADGRIAVIHDHTTKRTTGVDGKIGEMTLAQIQALDAGSFKSPTFKGEKIPSLEELLAVVPGGRRLVVELKGGKELLPGLETALAAVPHPPEAVEFIAFSYDTLVAVKQRFPRHRALWLLGYKVDKATGKPAITLDAAIERCREAHFDGLSLSKEWPIDAAFVATVRAAGLDLYVWTINDPAEAKRFAELGMPVICTDRPGVLRNALR
jgi:glycerophosphoryl diester phosphodiesterase